MAIATFVAFLCLIFLPNLSKGNTIKSYFFGDAATTKESAVFALFYLFLFGQLFLFNEKYTYLFIYILGTITALSGLMISFIARQQLGKVWSPITHPQRAKRIIDEGLFGMMRHPVYLGRLLFFLGVMMMLNLKGVVLSVVYWYCLGKKALDEERNLVRTNPEYRKYLKRVRRRFF